MSARTPYCLSLRVHADHALFYLQLTCASCFVLLEEPVGWDLEEVLHAEGVLCFNLERCLFLRYLKGLTEEQGYFCSFEECKDAWDVSKQDAANRRNVIILIDIDTPQRYGDQTSNRKEVTSQEPQSNTLDLMITFPQAPTTNQKGVTKQKKWDQCEEDTNDDESKHDLIPTESKSVV